LRERERIYLPHIITTVTTSTIVNITEAGCQRGTWCLSMLAACTNSNTNFFRKQIENKIKIQIDTADADLFNIK